MVFWYSTFLVNEGSTSPTDPCSSLSLFSCFASTKNYMSAWPGNSGGWLPKASSDVFEMSEEL
jgi:hypothetical protein